MKRAKLIELVKDEAKALRKNATQEELEKLQLDILDPSSKFTCIYGQITGNCFSERASQLIIKCAKRVYVGLDSKSDDIPGGILNGKPTAEIIHAGELFCGRREHYSPIEEFIYFKANQKNGNNERLINYLQGKTNSLRFVKF